MPLTTKKKPQPVLLAGDIGGTKTTLALYDAASWPGQVLRQRTYQNLAFESFDALMGEFLGREHLGAGSCCLGVAGPIFDNTVQMTNRNWSLSADALQRTFGFTRVDLVNDLVATGLGAVTLPRTEIQPLNEGTARPMGAIAVLAPGTGLGEAFLLPHAGGYLPGPSEGGHAGFSPRNRLQIDLLEFMLRMHDHVSVEQVCSGRALPDLLHFMATRYTVPPWLQEQLGTCADLTPVIIRAALDGGQHGQPCEIAVQTMRLFVDILAEEAANLALKTLSLGGLYLAGGLITRILPFLEPGRFMSVFARGIYRQFLARIPIHIVLNPETALLGAALYGYNRMTQRAGEKK